MLILAADVYFERLPWCNRFHNVARFFALLPMNTQAKGKVRRMCQHESYPSSRSMRSALLASTPHKTNPCPCLHCIPQTPSCLRAPRPTTGSGASEGERRTSRALALVGSVCRIPSATRTSWSQWAKYVQGDRGISLTFRRRKCTSHWQKVALWTSIC